jgi:hypothetical protein
MVMNNESVGLLVVNTRDFGNNGEEVSGFYNDSLGYR